MKHELYDDIIQALKDRSEWEQKQSVWYRMRHGGLRRGNKPYPNAPDLHFPLVDSNIEKLKPFYFQQLYAAETFAAFIALKPQSNELTTSASGWFDYKLKQQTNLEREILCAIDHMENNGSSLVKIYWDEEKKRLCFDARDPLYVIVPKMTNDTQDSDWLVDVIHMSEAQYRANSNFNQDDGFIKLIKGKDTSVSGAIAKREEAGRREGITMGATDDQIVLWEIYKKGDKAITVQTISPLQPLEDRQVRDDFDLPYNLGPFKSGQRIPFARFRMEIKDKGWYSPRGISEVLAPFETSICRMWNSKHEAMDFFNRPTFTDDGRFQGGNTSNIKMLPGQILPVGIIPTSNPTPPISFDEEMQATRAAAEYRLQIPDLGASRHYTPGGEGTKGNVTATQINAIVGQSSQSDDMRARIFRLDLAELYQMAWAIYLQYDRKSLDYVLADELTQVSDEALHDQYLIAPNGSADGWNKSLQIQKSVARKQMLGNSPYIDQGELDKTILELDDPKLVKRLWRDPGQASRNQMERQAEEVSIMLLGFPAEVEPSDDDVAHIQSWSGFIDRRMHAQEPITPEFAKLMIQHEQGHEQQMGQKRDKRLPQIKQAAMPYLQLLSQIAQSEQQPPNVIQGPGGQQPQQQIDPLKQAELAMKGQKQSADIQRDQAKVQLDAQKVAASLSNSLAALKKAGVPITNEEINKVLAQAGLPPLVQAVQPTPNQQIV